MKHTRRFRPIDGSMFVLLRRLRCLSFGVVYICIGVSL